MQATEGAGGRGLLEGDRLVYRSERKDGQQITGQMGEAQHHGAGRQANKQPVGAAGINLLHLTHKAAKSQRGGALPRVMWLVGGTASPELRLLTWCSGTSPGPQRNPKPGRSFWLKELLFQGCLPSQILTPGRCLFGIGGQPAPQAGGGGSGRTGV